MNVMPFIEEEKDRKGEYMGMVRATAYPSRYADKGWMNESAREEEPSVGKFSLRFDLMKAGGRRSAGAVRRQRSWLRCWARRWT